MSSDVQQVVNKRGRGPLTHAAHSQDIINNPSWAFLLTTSLTVFCCFTVLMQQVPPLTSRNIMTFLQKNNLCPLCFLRSSSPLVSGHPFSSFSSSTLIFFYAKGTYYNSFSSSSVKITHTSSVSHMTSDLLPISFTSLTQIDTVAHQHTHAEVWRFGRRAATLPLVSQIACNEMAKRAKMAAAVSLAVENAVGY